jgi:predicted AlkP superfamily pyrophosphatase or phosphodiesterase
MTAKRILSAIPAVLVAALACIVGVRAQQAQSGGIAERFKQYDKNGDGKVTRDEAPGLPMFDQWDTNKDGAVTLEEVTAFYAGRRGAGVSGSKPVPAGPAAATHPDRDGFVPDAPFVGQVNGSYVDPEFNEATSQVVFQDAQNRVWIGDIDPATGLFKSATTRDHLMDENITLIFDRPPQGRKFSTNGPEWATDAKGACVVYTKADETGVMQQWMARLVDGKSVVTQLTHNKLDSYGNMPSRFQDGKPPRVSYTYDWPIWKAKAAWIFTDNPAAPHEVPGFDYNKMSMWSAVSPDFLFVTKPAGAKHSQIGRANADTGKVTVLTNDEGVKDDPGMFRAPEFGGEICLMANVDNRAIAIYRDLKSPDGFWTRVATLTLPADAPYKFVSSPEPIAPATGIGGVSCFALLARESKDRNSPGSIWVLGLGNDPAKRLVRRVDDGAVTGEKASLLEPEPFVGTNEAYVYYNYYDFTGGRWGLRRARTGIKVGAAPVLEGQTPSASTKAKRLVMVCIDACRPDYLDLTETQNLAKLKERGVTYDQAWVGQLRNDTPPGHVTMATGAFPRTTGVIGFHWRNPDTGAQFKPTTWFGVQRGQMNQFVAASGCPSIGTMLKQANPGAKVAAVSSNKFYAAAGFGADCADYIAYCRYEPPRGFGTSVGATLAPETVTGRAFPADILSRPELRRKVTAAHDGDTWTVDMALALFEKARPEVLLVNLALTDDTGHTSGPTDRTAMTPMIANVDRQIGRLMEAYSKAGLMEETVFVVTSDHGMSANLRTIDETPMAPIVAEYGMERSAARLEFYVKDPAKAPEAAERIAALRMPGIHAVYAKRRDGEAVRYELAPSSRAGLADALAACYTYLLSTYAGRTSPDVVLFSAENWNIREASSYYRGDHGTTTWENQHIPLIIAGPGIKKGAISHAPARLVDVAPTIAAAMGLDHGRMDGIVLADALVRPTNAQMERQAGASRQLAAHRDALKNRHEADLAGTPAARQTAAANVNQPDRARWQQGGSGDRFAQFDRDRDGKVTRQEAANAPWFDRLDTNHDGIITRDELGRSGWGSGAAGPTATGPSASRGTAVIAPPRSTDVKTTVGKKASFTFARDYTPGTPDSKGRMRTGQELMRIVAYRGQLFASTSVFTDPRLYGADPNYTGCQVLRKSSSKSGWEVDISFGRRYLRTDCLEVVRFTRDAKGKPLPKPVEMLVAGIWDNGELVYSEEAARRDDAGRDVARTIFGRETGRRAGGSRAAYGNRHITIAVRDDATGKWTIVRVAKVPESEKGFSSVRAMRVHRDKVTGQECLYVGAACGGMYRGVYDPTAPGRIRWIEGDELDPTFGRVHSMCICNGSLYASTDYGGLLVQGQRGGIFRRIDGPKANWERVYHKYDPKYPTWNQTARGITAVPAEDGSGKEVILVGVEWPPAPIIVRIEPHKGHRAVTELNYHDYFAQVFGREPQILGGSKQFPHAGCECAALNYFEPFTNPSTGKTERFVTLFLIHPDDPAEGCNGAYFLIRRGPGRYDWGEIPSGLPAGKHLRGTRTVQKSPFKDEPNTYYFGGCFNGPDEQPPKPDMAWIYRGTLAQIGREKQ